MDIYFEQSFIYAVFISTLNLNMQKLHRLEKIHFVGIGGVGMAGIAEVLINLNYQISGSDLNCNNSTKRLEKLGAKIYYQHAEINITDCDVVVVSSAICKKNIEVITAQRKHIPVIPRAVMLAELMRFKQGIAISGTHGKTTTTSLIAWIFAYANLDPTYVIGGQLLSLGANAKLGKGNYFIAEADESDASFLYLNPILAVVTNIDNDHLGTYNHDFNKLKQAFLDFIHKLPFYGHAFVCIDDPVVTSILPEISRPYTTYGFNTDADIKAYNYHQQLNHSTFDVSILNKSSVTINCPLAGRHNACNILAAIGVALQANITLETISEALSKFNGIARRCQSHGKYKYNGGEILILEDYGHHPREIAAVIAAISEGWPNRLVMIYQPHRYTRTHDLFNDFTQVLSKVDVLLLLDVYSAGEEKIAGATSLDLLEAITPNNLNVHLTTTTSIWNTLKQHLQPNDIVLLQGAGDIYKLTPLIINNLKESLPVVI